MKLLIAISLVLFISLGCGHKYSYKKGLPSGTYVLSCLLLDSSNGFDTLWRGAVYFDSVQHIPIDTVFFAPSPLPEEGEQAERFFGKEHDLLAYAERKNIRRFCYKDTLTFGIRFFIHLKENENYQLESADHVNMGNAIAEVHKEGWSKLTTNMGYWRGDNILLTGESLCLGTGADAIIKCQYH